MTRIFNTMIVCYARPVDYAWHSAFPRSTSKPADHHRVSKFDDGDEARCTSL